MSDFTFQQDWARVLGYFQTLTGKKPDLNGVLFLIGVQELGQGIKPFSKEEKQDLMHIGTCKVLSLSAHYTLQGLDQQGWPHWVEAEPLPEMPLAEQEDYLKMHIVTYLEQELKVI